MVERSLSAFPKFLSEGIGNLVSPGSQAKSPTPGVGKGFETFIQTVNRYGSKYEEDESIQKELSLLRQKISSSDVTQVQIRDYLCRAIYCEILGYDVSFAYIHAVKLAQQGSLLEKRIGYLAASLLLHPGHELVLLLVNTIQKDLKSSNILDNCMALTAASQMIGPEMIPALLPMVLEKLKHNRELVQQKAVLCLYRFQLLAPDLLAHVQPDLERMIFDKDPGVMAAALNIVNYNTEQAPTKYLHVVDTLVFVMQQVLSRKMSSMFEFHSVPFPWLQIKILRCLSNITSVDEKMAKKVSPLLIEVLQRASAKENIAYALIYECLICVATVKPSKQLMEEASRHVGRFMRSSDSNLRYVGIKALIGLVKVDPYFVMDYQGLIVDSLEQSDLTIQRKMYKLLYQIANPSNIEVIAEKLLYQLENSLDKYWRSEVISMVMNLSKRYEPSLSWPYNTKLRCLQLGRDCVTSTLVESVISDLLTVITTSKLELKQFLVKKCIECLMTDKTHHNVMHVTAWALAELSSLLTKLPEDRVLSLYTRHLCNPDHPDHIKASLISGLQKLACDRVISNETMATGISECLKVRQSVLIKRRLTILYQLCKLGNKIRLCRDPDQFDFTLSFLDTYLSQCIEQGASPYKPRHLRLGTKTEDQIPQVSLAERVGIQSEPTGAGTVYSSSQYRSGSSTSSGIIKDESEAKLDLSGVKRIWGRQGIINKTPGDQTMQLHSEESNIPEKSSEKQQMAAALFGGLKPVTNRTEYSDGAMGYTDLFGAADQDFNTVLPTCDTAGWRNMHKGHSEKLEDDAMKMEDTSLENLNHGALKMDDTSLENLNLQIGKDRMECKDASIHESEMLHDFGMKDKNNLDTGYESKIKYSECFDNQESICGNVEALQNLSLSPVTSETDMKRNTAMREESETTSANSVHRENPAKPENVPDFAFNLETLSNESMTKDPKEGSAHSDLDDALTLLLNDSSNFVNISVVTNNEDSSFIDSDTVKVRESIYSPHEEEKPWDDMDRDRTDSESVKGSLYDDDI